MRRELPGVLDAALTRERSLEQTQVTPRHEGFECLGFRSDRNGVGSGPWAPRRRLPARAMEKVRSQVRAALDPTTHENSVGINIPGLHRLIGGWCRDDHTTARPSRYVSQLAAEVVWVLAHWRGRHDQINRPRVMRSSRRGKPVGTGTSTLEQASGLTAKRHRLRTIKTPDTAEVATTQRAHLDILEAEWIGTAERQGG